MRDHAKSSTLETKDRPKVLYFITKSNWGGAQRYVHNLAVDSKMAGWDVAVICGGAGELTEKLQESGIRVISLSKLNRDINLNSDISVFFELRKILKDERPDVFHVNSSKAGGVGSLVGRLLRIPFVVFTAHGWAFNDPKFKSPFKQLMARLLHLLTVLFAHKTIAVADILIKQLGGPSFIKRRFVSIKNGVEPVNLLTRPEARENLSELSNDAKDVLEWADRHKAFIVGALSELHRVKGIDVLIESIYLLSKRYPEKPVAGIIFGEGEERLKLEEQISTLGIKAQIALVGFVPEATKLLSIFDCFVMPSRSEALPLALLEAGSAELPIIASRVGGIPEIVEQRVSGILISPERPRELAEAIRFVLSNPIESRKMGENLNRTVRNNHSRTHSSTETLKLYRSALADK